MHINTDQSDFFPTDVVYAIFYNNPVLFCWNENKFITYFLKGKDSLTIYKVITAPAPIKKVRCRSDRIFVICHPCGIYKLLRTNELVVLSRTAVELGTFYYETLTLKYGCLYIENKLKKCSENILALNESNITSNDICFCELSPEETVENLRDVLWDNSNVTKKLKLIAFKHTLYKLSDKSQESLFTCSESIIDIIPVHNGNKVCTLILTVDSNRIIIIYNRNKKLLFETVVLHSDKKSLCFGIYGEYLWIIYSNTEKLYYKCKNLLDGSTRFLKSKPIEILCLYKNHSNKIYGLNSMRNIVELQDRELKNLMDFEDEHEFKQLSINMLRNTEFLMENVYDRVKHLENLNISLLDKQEKLKQLNMFACQYRISILPTLTVNKITKFIILKANFQDTLPPGSIIVFCLKFGHQRIFNIKTIENSDNVIEIKIGRKNTFKFEFYTIDLITHVCIGNAWCLIKNYITNPDKEKEHKIKLQQNKRIFILNKITVLKRIMSEKTTNFSKLIEIKISIRKELSDI